MVLVRGVFSALLCIAGQLVLIQPVCGVLGQLLTVLLRDHLHIGGIRCREVGLIVDVGRMGRGGQIVVRRRDAVGIVGLGLRKCHVVDARGVQDCRVVIGLGDGHARLVARILRDVERGTAVAGRLHGRRRFVRAFRRHGGSDDGH